MPANTYHVKEVRLYFFNKKWIGNAHEIITIRATKVATPPVSNAISIPHTSERNESTYVMENVTRKTAANAMNIAFINFLICNPLEPNVANTGRRSRSGGLPCYNCDFWRCRWIWKLGFCFFFCWIAKNRNHLPKALMYFDLVFPFSNYPHPKCTF